MAKIGDPALAFACSRRSRNGSCSGTFVLDPASRKVCGRRTPSVCRRSTPPRLVPRLAFGDLRGPARPTMILVVVAYDHGRSLRCDGLRPCCRWLRARPRRGTKTLAGTSVTAWSGAQHLDHLVMGPEDLDPEAFSKGAARRVFAGQDRPNPRLMPCIMPRPSEKRRGCLSPILGEARMVRVSVRFSRPISCWKRSSVQNFSTPHGR